MATYTPNYGLHQWVPEDQFLRTDFNEDFKKIDTALKTVEEQTKQDARTAQATADRVLGGVELVGYHAASLMIQQGKKGDAIRYHNGLFAEPFYDKGSISSMSGYFHDHIDHRIILSNQEPTAYTYYYGQTNQTAFTPGNLYTLDWDCQQTGIIKKADYYLTGGSSSNQVKFELLDSQMNPIGGTVNGGATGNHTVTMNYPVEKGKSYYFRVTNISGTTLQGWSLPGAYFGLRYYIGYSKSSSGTLTTPSMAVPSYTGARAWVRHSGETVTPSLFSGSTWHTMEKENQRSTYTVEGLSCQESIFTLERLTPSSSVQIRLGATASSGATNYIYEYAVLFL